ncbi:TPA: PAAR domain-containing protein, partial [Citrobacter braakii]|nr:PAAR domain-containing protein [Citrobacter braakii]
MGSMGFYLRVGDLTTCGGKILTGDETLSWYGVAGAREGDAVSCGKHPGMYKILGGTSDTWDEGRRLAGTLDSVSSCPCRARFIQSIPDCYIKDDTPEEQAEKARLLA